VTAVADSRKLLLVKGVSGMGNRILGVLTGIIYTRLTGRRLVVDWRDDVYSGGGVNVFPRYFQCAEAGSTDEIPDTDSVTPAIWRGRLGETLEQVERATDLDLFELRRRSSVDLTKLDHPEQVAVLWATMSRALFLMTRHRHAFGALGGLPAYELLRRLLREDLLLRPPIRERVDELARAMDGETTVGVHVRFSDRRADLRAIRRTLEIVLQRTPNARIFLSTDNNDVKVLFEQAYPRVATSPHWYSPAGTAAHGADDRPDRFAIGAEALVDLYLLAGCDYLVADTFSSFARVALLLSGAPSSRITDGCRPAQRRRRLNDVLVGVSPRLAHEIGCVYERATVGNRYLDPSALRKWLWHRSVERSRARAL
jgi:hypothetical protein